MSPTLTQEGAVRGGGAVTAAGPATLGSALTSGGATLASGYDVSPDGGNRLNITRKQIEELPPLS